MNAAGNKTQNLNYNPHNPNLTNPGSKKFARDYDKEPLVIKSYEDFFVETLFFMPLAFSIIVTIFIMGLVEDKSMDNILSLSMLDDYQLLLLCDKEKRYRSFYERLG